MPYESLEKPGRTSLRKRKHLNGIGSSAFPDARTDLDAIRTAFSNYMWLARLSRRRVSP